MFFPCKNFINLQHLRFYVLCHFHSFFCGIMIIWYMINVKFTKVKRVTHYKICVRFL